MNDTFRMLGAAIATAAVATIVGCAPAHAPARHADTPTATSAAGHPVATSSIEPAGVEGTITPLDGTAVKVGGPPVRFTVALVNNGPDIDAVGLVVSLGHCSCGPPGASMMAEGSMRLLDPQSGAWLEAPYVREGTGMDYVYGNLVPPFRLSHGQTVSFELEMRVDAEQSAPITDGEGSIHAMVTDPDDPLDHPRTGVGHMRFSVEA